MRKTLLFLLLSMSLLTVASGQGISFETGTWQQVVDKAKKENKLIFLDIYAVWCGPCKQMDKNIFPDAKVGEFYNKNFISYKIDGEKGEGITLAKKYDVKAYPTNLYLNPKDLTVVSKEMGYVDVPAFITRGDQALKEFKDPRSWADYTKAYKSKSGDKTFLEDYIRKGNKLDKNIDHAIDLYIQQFTPAQPDAEFIGFLSQNIKTLNNKGVDYITDLYSYTSEQIAMLDEWLPGLYDNTLDNAVATKDPKKLERILWASQKTKNPQAQNIYNRFITAYYAKINDMGNYWKAVENEMNVYLRTSIKEYRQQDSVAFQSLIADYGQQLKGYGVPEDQFMSYINETLKDKKEEAEHQTSYMTAAFINEALDQVLEKGAKNQELLKKATIWSDFMLELAQPFTYQWAEFAMNAAEIYALNSDKARARTTLETALEKARGNRPIQVLVKEELKKYQ